MGSAKGVRCDRSAEAPQGADSIQPTFPVNAQKRRQSNRTAKLSLANPAELPQTNEAPPSPDPLSAALQRQVDQSSFTSVVACSVTPVVNGQIHGPPRLLLSNSRSQHWSMTGEGCFPFAISDPMKTKTSHRPHLSHRPDVKERPITLQSAGNQAKSASRIVQTHPTMHPTWAELLGER
jgi:hypothetical protein